MNYAVLLYYKILRTCTQNMNYAVLLYYKILRTCTQNMNYAISENCALLGYYAARSDNFIPMLRDNLSVPSSGVKTWILGP